MAPTTALTQVLAEVPGGRDAFARLGGDFRFLLARLVLAYGREQLLTGNGAADQAARVVVDVTGSSSLGDAARRAVRVWAASA